MGSNSDYVNYALAQALGHVVLVKLAGTAVAYSGGSGPSSVLGSGLKGAAVGGLAGAGWKAHKGGNILKGGKTGALIGGLGLAGLAAIKKLKS